MFPLEQGAVGRGLCAVDDEIVLPAAMLLPPRPSLRLPDGFRCPEHRGKSHNKRHLLRHGAHCVADGRAGSTPHLRVVHLGMAARERSQLEDGLM
jgi:hypothetical protein